MSRSTTPRRSRARDDRRLGRGQHDQPTTAPSGLQEDRRRDKDRREEDDAWRAAEDALAWLSKPTP